jgi:cytochrome c-type biogenesis protein CcmH/NrfG
MKAIALDRNERDAQYYLDIALNEKGDAAVTLAAYQEILAIDRNLAKNKTNAQAQRDLAVSSAVP